jgi:hypothetical protein
MAEGMGKFSGTAFSGGLSGVMDKGLTFASDMMSNLVSGAKDTASDNLQKTTIGGRMAANIDADNAANLAEITKEDNGVPSPGAVGQDGKDGGPSGPGNNVGNPLASGESTSMDTGKSAGGSFDGGGSISSGGGSSVSLDDYAAGLASYDPGKIGLPDEE